MKQQSRKKNKKPLYFLSALLLFFAVFIYFLIRPSLQTTAIGQIQICSNTNDVKSIYERYKFELLESDEFGNKIVSKEFQDEVRKKLSTFNLTEEEILECIKWLPPAQTNLNVIIIPDLSRRISDSYNNPNQIENDKFVLNQIWKSFAEYSKFKQDTKDFLMIDVTDIDQAKGQFSNIANELQFDLSEHKGKSNRLFFSKEKEKQFEDNIIKLYDAAKQKPLGADYVFYFKRYLINHIKKPTLFENYLNKVIIITDGYLEPETRAPYTKLTLGLYKSLSIGNTKELITNLNLNIPKTQIDLSNTDILVCEINERHEGKAKDFEILKAYWEDWLTRMNAHKIMFIQREQANQLTKKRIQDFFKQ